MKTGRARPATLQAALLLLLLLGKPVSFRNTLETGEKTSRGKSEGRKRGASKRRRRELPADVALCLEPLGKTRAYEEPLETHFPSLSFRGAAATRSALRFRTRRPRNRAAGPTPPRTRLPARRPDRRRLRALSPAAAAPGRGGRRRAAPSLRGPARAARHHRPAQRCAGPAGQSGPPALTEVIEREAALVRGTRLETLGPEVHSCRHDGGTQTLPARRAPYAGRPADRGAGPAGAPSTSSGEPPLMGLDLGVQGPPSAARPRPSYPGPAPGLRKAGTLRHLLRGGFLIILEATQWQRVQPSSIQDEETKFREGQQLAQGHTASIHKKPRGQVDAPGRLPLAGVRGVFASP